MSQTRPVSLDEYLSFMTAFPTGVAITTAMDSARRPAGMTITSLSSVTVRPPTLLICLAFGQTLDTALDAGRFTVNLLTHDAQAIAVLFSSREPDRFLGVDWAIPPGAAGPHLTKNSFATADCAVIASNEVSDHVVLFGSVDQVTTYADRRPLLYGFRTFSAWDADDPDDSRDNPS